MTASPPPVPPANRTDKGPGGADRAPTETGPKGSGQTRDPDKIGQAGNSKVNTTNQGYQQDR